MNTQIQILQILVGTRTLSLNRHTAAVSHSLRKVPASLLLVALTLLPAAAHAQGAIEAWVQRYNGPGNGADQAFGLAVDTNGNAYVTGPSTAANGYADYATIKYSSAGVPLWTNYYNGPGNREDWAAVVAGDASGNVYVTGYSVGAGVGQQCATIKYSSTGTGLWTNRYSAAYSGKSLAVDASGNLLVTGGGASGCTTVKYSSGGALLWARTYSLGFPGFISEVKGVMAVDPSGNVVVTGNSYDGPDYLTVKYSSAGALLWTNRYNGSGNGWDRYTHVAVDASGNVYVTGGSGGDYATIAYSSAGLPLWTNRYNGPANSGDEPYALALDPNANVYVTGSSGGDYATVKYVVPPIITRQPLSRTNLAGSTASFTVEVAGSAPLGCQWRRQGTNLVDGGNLSGVSTTNLLIANVQLADAAGYSVVVTNAHGNVTSSVARLTVIVSPGRFSNLSYSPETGFSFIFRDATVGRPYRIQISPSPAEGSWTDWLSFTYIGPIGISDLSALDAERRFYRAVSP